MSFTALVASTGFIFIVWHTWHYDRWRCLMYSKHGWFRALMCHILLGSVCAFVVYAWIDVNILYDEYYAFVGGKTVPKPWQLWSSHNQRQYRANLYVLCTGWSLLQAVHLEEFLYWAYLIVGIKSTHGQKQTWIQSPFFKLWVAGATCATAICFGGVSIEQDNLAMMKAYMWVIGSALSCLLSAASVALCLVCPSFITTMRRQGASPEVLERLYFFSELNQLRTVFRIVYSTFYLTTSIDAFTSQKRITNSPFWSDFLYIAGQLSVFAATCLSVIILLPRNMTSESLPQTDAETFHPMVPYKRAYPIPGAESSAQRHFFELGDRLNVDRDALAGGLNNDSSYELNDSPRTEEGKLPQGVHFEVPPLPLLSPGGHSRRTRFSEVPSLTGAMSRIKSPFEGPPLPPLTPTRVMVTTSQTIHRD